MTEIKQSCQEYQYFDTLCQDRGCRVSKKFTEYAEYRSCNFLIKAEANCDHQIACVYNNTIPINYTINSVESTEDT